MCLHSFFCIIYRNEYNYNVSIVGEVILKEIDLTQYMRNIIPIAVSYTHLDVYKRQDYTYKILEGFHLRKLFCACAGHGTNSVGDSLTTGIYRQV